MANKIEIYNSLVSEFGADLFDHRSRYDLFGICKACTTTQTPVEPDARNYTCAACNRPKVYGVEWVLMSDFVAYKLLDEIGEGGTVTPERMRAYKAKLESENEAYEANMVTCKRCSYTGHTDTWHRYKDTYACPKCYLALP